MGWQVGCYSSAALTFSASHTLISDWYGTSRLLAAILMRSSKSSGNLREIDRFEGLRFGNRTRAAALVKPGEQVVVPLAADLRVVTEDLVGEVALSNRAQELSGANTLRSDRQSVSRTVAGCARDPQALLQSS